MRVVHVLDAMGGGTKKHIDMLIAGQLARGLDVTLALPLRREFSARSALMDYDFPAAMRARGVRVEQFPFVHGRIAPLTDIGCLLALMRFLRRERFDVVHTHSAKAGILGRFAAAMARVPAIVHTPYSLPFRPEQSRRLHYWLYYVLERVAGLVTDVMIASSTGERQEIIDASLVPPDRVRVIPNCFDLDRYPYAFDGRAEAKVKMGLDPTRFVIGTIARLSPQKDVVMLVEAAARVRQSGIDADGIIVGDGEQRAMLEQRIADLSLTGHVTLTGARADYLDFLRAFDVFAFPSLWEGLPYAPIEAMAVGTPVVATAASGTTDLVEDGSTGLLVSLRDADALSRAVARVLTDKTLARQIAERARRFVQSRFDLDGPVRLTLDAYDVAMPRPAQPLPEPLDHAPLATPVLGLLSMGHMRATLLAICALLAASRLVWTTGRSGRALRISTSEVPAFRPWILAGCPMGGLAGRLRPEFQEYERGLLAWQRGDAAEAAADWQHARGLAAHLAACSVVEMESGRHQNALTLSGLAVQLDSTIQRARLVAGRSLVATGRLAEGSGTCALEPSDSPWRALALVCAGDAEWELQHWDVALGRYREAIGLNADLDTAQAGAGKATWAALHDLPGALQHIERAKTLNRASPWYPVLEGDVRDEAGQTRQALGAYEEATTRSPAWWLGHYRVATARWRLGDETGARAALADAARLAGDDVGAQTAIARATRDMSSSR